MIVQIISWQYLSYTIKEYSVENNIRICNSVRVKTGHRNFLKAFNMENNERVRI